MQGRSFGLFLDAGAVILAGSRGRGGYLGFFLDAGTVIWAFSRCRDGHLGFVVKEGRVDRGGSECRESNLGLFSVQGRIFGACPVCMTEITMVSVAVRRRMCLCSVSLYNNYLQPPLHHTTLTTH
mgnify:CR=1 FL=1